MHEQSFDDVVGKKPVALLFATPQLCQSRVCGPVTDIALQMKAKYGDKMDFIHQEVYVDNDPQQGPARAAAGVQPAHRAVAVRGRRRRQDHRPARGLVRPEGVRGRDQDRALACAAGSLRRRGARRAGDRVRPRRARPAQPTCRSRVAVRLGGRDRARGLVRRAGALWPKPRLERPPWRPLPSGRRACSVSRGVEDPVRRDRRRAAGDRDAGRLRRAGTALDNFAPTFILITFWVGLVFACRSCSATSSAPSARGARSAARSALVGRARRRAAPYPERLGRWPAAAGLLVFTWIELVGGLGRGRRRRWPPRSSATRW